MERSGGSRYVFRDEWGAKHQARRFRLAFVFNAPEKTQYLLVLEKLPEEPQDRQGANISSVFSHSRVL